MDGSKGRNMENHKMEDFFYVSEYQVNIKEGNSIVEEKLEEVDNENPKSVNSCQNLLRFCLKNRLRLPKYVIKNDYELFEISCTVQDYTESAKGKNLESLRQNAAFKVLEILEKVVPFSTKDKVKEKNLFPTSSETQETRQATEKPNIGVELHFVQELFEYCAKNGLQTPIFELSKINELFRVKCHGGECSAYWSSPDEEFSQQKAAALTLQRLKLREVKNKIMSQLFVTPKPDSQPGRGDSSSNSLGFEPKCLNIKSYDTKNVWPSNISIDDANFNAIGALTELCLKTGRSCPKYDAVSDQGWPNMKRFLLRCTVDGKSEEGTGPRKQNAKMEAAKKLYKVLIRQADTACNPSRNNAVVPKDTPAKFVDSDTVLNPIGQLIEYCVKKHLPQPTYTFVEVLISRLPHFVSKCTLGELHCEGDGPTKKQAKQAAALKMYSQVLGQRNVSVESGSSSNVAKCPVSTPVISEDSDAQRINYVGKLSELCVKSGLPAPKFQVVAENGPPHFKTFIIKCIANGVVEEGNGRTKSIAKREAASKVLLLLQQTIEHEF